MREARRTRPARGAPTKPTEASLHEAALAYLARSAATTATLRRTLERRVRTWTLRATRAGADAEEVAAHAERAREWVGAIAARFAEVGLVDDAAFAAARAERLGRGGRSRRAIAAHLAAKGVDAELTRSVLPDAGEELASAIAFARRRRIGPFARDPGARDDPKALAAMARAGFDYGVCVRALRMPREEAEERLARGRSF